MNMNIRVEEYVRPDGSCPYQDWFDGLDAQAAAKMVTAKLRLELGNTSNVKWFAGIGECVINWGPGYRIYLAKDGESLLVLFWRWNEAPTTGRHREGEGLARRVQGSKIRCDGQGQVKEAIEVTGYGIDPQFQEDRGGSRRA
jgi:putative addiction module killer protein